jgi:APA family basic amino acid/polyamine antiporter
MLNYIITIAISAFFVPHYLSIFWEPLRENPWDIIGGAAVIGVLVALNIVGIQESARINIVLAVVDFATQVLLVLIGFVLVFSPETLTSNIHFGVAPTWSNFLLAIPVGMIAYTGIETVSNLSEEARDPVKSVPRAISMVAVAVYAIYFTLPLVALSAMPVELVDGEYQTTLGLPPEEGGYANDPVLGLVQNLGIESDFLLSSLEIYVGVLAATILFVATNAGVIGASRITYAMAGYRQLPELFRRLHPTFKTPWLALTVFAGLFSILVLLPGQLDFLSTMYSFGAMLSFTVAHAAIIQLRRRRRDEELSFRARPNVRWRGVDWPLFAVFGGTATAAAWLVVVVQTPATRYAGLGWLVAGFALYALYRRRLGLSLRETARAPVQLGPAVALEYRNILVAVVTGPEGREAVDLAARLSAERGATIVALRAIVVPLDQRLDAELPEQEDLADRLLDEARAAAELYGVRMVERIVRGRSAGRAIVEEAERRQSEVIVLGAPRATRREIFGKTVDYVLKHAPCRVIVAAGRRAA